MTYPVKVRYSPSSWSRVESWMETSNITNYDVTVAHDYTTGAITVQVMFVHQADSVQFKLAWPELLV